MSTEPDPPWAVWDMEGQAWLGDKAGPKLFHYLIINGQPVTAEYAARFAATFLNDKFKKQFRFRAMLYDGTGTRHKDTITAP